PGAARAGARVRRRLRAKLALALLVTGVLAIGVEIFARVRYRARDLLVGDEAWIERWFEMREAKTAPSESLPLAPTDAVHRPDRELGWVPVEHSSRDGVSTNSLGLRGTTEQPFEWSVDGPDGDDRIVPPRRILVIGDSFTFGDGVRDDEVWTELLAKRI